MYNKPNLREDYGVKCLPLTLYNIYISHELIMKTATTLFLDFIYTFNTVYVKHIGLK